MEETLKDNRFAHVAKDPRFRKMKKQHRKVKIDKRFQSMFQDKRFKVKYSVDKRGRPTDTSTDENLKKYYELASDDGSDSDDLSGEEDKAGQLSNSKVSEKRDNKLTKADSGNPKSGTKGGKDGQKPKLSSDSTKKLSHGTTVESEMSESESGEEESADSVSDPNDQVKSQDGDDDVSEEEESGESESVDDTDEGSDSEEEVQSEDEGIGPDLARGEGLVDSSTDDESDSDESCQHGEDIEHAWGEMDRETERTAEVTRRLAVCNMDWDRVKAQDILVLLNSFKPPGGTLKSVHIYPSEFGIQRMKEEELKGPAEITEQKQEEASKGGEFQREKLREYQLKRLRYYYAVVQCDSEETANHIYEQCDGLEFESTGNKLDLRFIPDDMEFDQEPKSVATDVINVDLYRPKSYVTSALQQSKVQCTWDETDHDRLQVTMRKFDKEELEDLDLKDYIASESEAESEYGGSKLTTDIKDSESEDEQVNKYKQLLQEITDKEQREERDIDMQISWEPGLKDNTEKLVKKKAKEDITPWENYLEKKKEKKKIKRSKKKESEAEEAELDELVAEDSDSDVPEGVDLNDPYFKEEMDRMDREDEKQKKKKGVKKEKSGKKKKNLSAEERNEREQKEAELQLLLMDEEDQREHFNLKQLMADDTTNMSKSKRKKLKKKKLGEPAAQHSDNFKMEVDDPRFTDLFENPHYNIDPSAPEFKKTKAVDLLIEEKQKRAKHKATKKTHNSRDSDGISTAKRQKLGNKDPQYLEKVQNSGNPVVSVSVINEPVKIQKDDLTSLIKSVKAKTQVLQKKKKKF